MQRWTIDWDEFEAALTPDVKIFWLCHPHNPTGMVFDKEDRHVADICERKMLIVSDEIWDDIVLDETSTFHLPAWIIQLPASNNICRCIKHGT